MNTRTNVVLNDKLVRQAMKATGARTKREVLTRGLQELVRQHAQKNILDLVGQDLIDPDYDVRVARGKRPHGAR